MRINSTKLIIIIAGFIFVAVLIGMIVIRDQTVDTDITADTTKVGLVIVGPKDDSSYNQAHYEALMRIKDELNLEIICRENVAEDESSREVMEELIEKEGCRFIIGASFGYGEYIVSLAKEYPEISFLHPTGTVSLANLSTCMGRMYQARYLAGIVAGMRTKTGKIGYVAAFPFSEVIRGLNAFTLGVRSVAPEAEVYVRYCESWVGDDEAEEATLKLLDAHPDIDVFSMHTNSLKPDEIASERGIWSVGYNLDNSEKFPDSYLTAAVWQWDSVYKSKILSSLQGKYHGEVLWNEMQTGIVKLSELTKNVASGTREAIDKAIDRIYSRSFDVFYGPIKDNTGKLKVPEGESMSDDELLNRFDWYVEGVKVEE